MKIFISYRRGDTRDFAGRLADWLKQEPQIDQVFLDVDGIEPGADFKAKIQKAVKQSGACVVLMGSEWTGKSASGAPARIFEENDFVRLEVREALDGASKIIPVLVNGATMPRADELPDELRRLTQLNAISVRHDSFKRDADFLAGAILSRKEPGWFARYWNRHPGQHAIVRALSGIVIAAVLLIGAAAIYQSITGLALNQTLGGTGQVIMLVAGVLLLGALLPLIFRPRRRRVA